MTIKSANYRVVDDWSYEEEVEDLQRQTSLDRESLPSPASALELSICVEFENDSVHHTPAPDSCQQIRRK